MFHENLSFKCGRFYRFTPYELKLSYRLNLVLFVLFICNLVKFNIKRMLP